MNLHENKIATANKRKRVIARATADEFGMLGQVSGSAGLLS